MTGRVVQHHFDNSSLDNLSTRSLTLPHFKLDNRSIQKPRKSFLHGSTNHQISTPREHLSSLIEEGNGNDPSGDLVTPPVEWNYLVTRDGARSSSPSNSIRSGNSSPSEVGDSGVCSEHDTPPPRTRVAQRHHLLSSDSDNESSVSTDSIHEFHKYSDDLSKDHFSTPENRKARHAETQRKKTYRNFIPPRLRLPESLLREICEKSRLMKKRRQQTWRDSGGDEGVIPPSADRCHLNGRNTGYNKLTSSSRRNSYTNLHSIEQCSLSLTSSKFSSTSSLVAREDVYPDNSAYYNFSDSNNQNLFECQEEGAGVGFAGLKDIYSLQKQESTIRSYKGTVRGVKNRVRAGIATFMSDHQNLKFTEQEKGRLVVYMTTMGVVRETHERCLRIRKILWTQLAAFEERDLFLSRDTQIELIDRLHLPRVSLPHVFIEGQYLGNAERIEELNETGELKRLILPYKRSACQSLCEKCGGYKFLPCSVCGGSKKSIHRNHFTLEFVALKCSACDESGLIKCEDCPQST